MTIDDQYLTNLRGKMYIQYAGLLDMAHKNGLKSIVTELISYSGVGKEAVVKATADGERGTFTGLGDACPQNVGKGIATCTLRMAETRGKARALRDYLGIGMCSVEEMPPDEPAKKLADPPPRAPAPRAPTNGGDSAINDRLRAIQDLPDPPCTKCGGPTRKTKRWENPSGSKAPWYSCKDYDFKTRQGCNGGIWDLPSPQAEMDSLDAADRYDDSLDFNTEDPPF